MTREKLMLRKRIRQAIKIFDAGKIWHPQCYANNGRWGWKAYTFSKEVNYFCMEYTGESEIY